MAIASDLPLSLELQLFRSRFSLTQAQLGEMLDMPFRTICHWEQGRRCALPGLLRLTLRLLADTLNESKKD